MDDLDRIIDRVYDGAANPAAWSGAMSLICDTLRADHAIAMIGDGLGAIPFLAPANVDSGPLENFVDSVVGGASGWLAPIPTGKTLNFDSLMPRQQLVRTQFFNDVIRPMGGGRAVISVPFRGDGAIFSCLVACRSSTGADFDDDTITLVDRLLPHVRRALVARLGIERTAYGAAVAFDAIDGADLAVAIVHDDMRPVAFSCRAAEILAAGDGLVISGRQLTAKNADDDRALQRLVRAAAANDSRAPVRYTMRLTRRAPHSCGSVIVRRLEGATAANGARPVVAIYFETSERRPADLSALLATAFGLTPREAALAAALAAGSNLVTVADALGMGIGTARNHLKAIFLKTDTRRQGQLIALIAQVKRFGA